MTKHYTLETWANGYRQWFTKIRFTPPGLGNTPEAQALAHRALRNAKRHLRKTIQQHDNAHPTYRFAWVIIDNHETPNGRLQSLTITERNTR